MGDCLIIKRGGGTDTSDATATAAQILSGKTAYVNDVKVIGTMVNKGAVTSTLNCGGSYTIPAGYHNGSGKVTVNSLASQTDATAVAGNILKDKTAWVKGSKITGTMVNQGTKTSTLAMNGSYTIPAGWHSGSGKVTQSAPTSVGGKTYTPKATKWTGFIPASRWVTGNSYIAGSSTLIASNIKKGVTILGVTGTYTPTTAYFMQNGALASGVIVDPATTDWTGMSGSSQGKYPSGYGTPSSHGGIVILIKNSFQMPTDGYLKCATHNASTGNGRHVLTAWWCTYKPTFNQSTDITRDDRLHQSYTNYGSASSDVDKLHPTFGWRHITSDWTYAVADTTSCTQVAYLKLRSSTNGWLWGVALPNPMNSACHWLWDLWWSASK